MQPLTDKQRELITKVLFQVYEDLEYDSSLDKHIVGDNFFMTFSQEEKNLLLQAICNLFKTQNTTV